MIKKNTIKLFLLLVFSLHFSFSQNKVLEENSLNNERVEALANTIANAIYNSNSGAYIEKIDFNVFGQNIQIEDQEYKDDKYHEALLKGYLNGLKALPERIIESVENGDYYDFISYRYDAIKKSYYILFRMFSVEAGLNYHDYKIHEVDDELALGDIYIYTSGENISDTFRRLYLTSLPKNKLSKLFNKKALKDFEATVEGFLAHRNGDSNKAYKILNSLDGDITKEKFFLLIKSQVAQSINDILYQKVLKEIIDTFPNDATLQLNHIDYYILTKDYDSALNIIEQLEFQTSDDFLAFMKGNIELERSNYEKASEYFKYITENYPDFFEGSSNYLVSLTLEEKYTEAVSYLEQLIEEGYAKVDLINFVEEDDEAGENILKPLMEVDVFKTWKKE